MESLLLVARGRTFDFVDASLAAKDYGKAVQMHLRCLQASFYGVPEIFRTLAHVGFRLVELKLESTYRSLF